MKNKKLPSNIIFEKSVLETYYSFFRPNYKFMVVNEFTLYTCKGVGCSKNYADNWVAHQDDFNDLLASLNQGSDVQKDPTQVQSLEEKGKQSKGRLQ